MSLPRLPLTLVSSLERTLNASVAAVPSAFTGTEQIQDWGGRWWELHFEMALTKGRDGRILSAFLAALAGASGRFVFADPSAAAQALIPGAPLVEGAGQSGHTLMTSGWAPNGPALRAGDLFSLGSDSTTRLYQLTEDVAPDEIGRAALRFVPALRGAPGDLEPLEIVAPALCLRLTAPVPTRITRADSYRFTISAREAL